MGKNIFKVGVNLFFRYQKRHHLQIKFINCITIAVFNTFMCPLWDLMATNGRKSSIWTMGKIGLFLLVGLVKRWQIPLAINSIVGRLNRYLLNNSLSVMVSKGLLLSLYTLGLVIIAFLSLLRLLKVLKSSAFLSFLTPSWILSKLLKYGLSHSQIFKTFLKFE